MCAILRKEVSHDPKRSFHLSCLVGEFQSLWGGIANEQVAEAGIEIDTRDRNNTIQFEPR